MTTGTLPAPAYTMTTRQYAVYTVLGEFGPLSDKELVARYDSLRVYVGYADIAQSPSGLRSRRAELVRMGYVRRAGSTPSTWRVV